MPIQNTCSKENQRRMSDLRQWGLSFIPTSDPIRNAALQCSWSENGVIRTPDVYGQQSLNNAIRDKMEDIEPHSMFNFQEREGTLPRGNVSAPPMHIPSMSTSLLTSLPSEKLEDISAPAAYDSDAPSTRTRLRNGCMESAPWMFESEATFARLRSLPSECLDDVSAPSMYETDISSIRSRALPSAYLQNQSPPRMYQDGTSFTHLNSLPSERLDDESAPSMYQSRALSAPSRSLPSEYLQHESPLPMYQNGASFARLRSLPSECLDDVSAPSMYETDISSIRSRVLPSAYLQNQSPTPIYQKGTSFAHLKSLPSERLDDESALSMYQSGTSFTKTRSHQEHESPPPMHPTEVSSVKKKPYRDEGVNNTDASQSDFYQVTSHQMNTSPNGGTSTHFFDALYCEVLDRLNAMNMRVRNTSNTTSSCQHSCTGNINSNRQLPSCLKSARKITSTQIIGKGSDSIYETVIENVAIADGKLEKSIKCIYAKRDLYGNVITQTNESKTILGGGSHTQLEQINQDKYLDSAIANESPKQPAANRSKLWNPIRKTVNFSRLQQYSPCTTPSLSRSSFPCERLDNISVASFAKTNSSPDSQGKFASMPRDRMELPPYRRTWQTIGRSPSQESSRQRPISFPSNFNVQMSSYLNDCDRYSITNRGANGSHASQYFRDVSAPQHESYISRTFSQRFPSLPRERISDISQPTFPSSGSSKGFSMPTEQQNPKSTPSQPSTQAYRKLLFPTPCFGNVSINLSGRNKEVIGLQEHNLPNQQMLYTYELPNYTPSPAATSDCNESKYRRQDNSTSRIPSEHLDDISAAPYGSGFLCADSNLISNQQQPCPNDRPKDASVPIIDKTTEILCSDLTVSISDNTPGSTFDTKTERSERSPNLKTPSENLPHEPTPTLNSNEDLSVQQLGLVTFENLADSSKQQLNITPSSENLGDPSPSTLTIREERQLTEFNEDTTFNSKNDTASKHYGVAQPSEPSGQQLNRTMTIENIAEVSAGPYDGTEVPSPQRHSIIFQSEILEDISKPKEDRKNDTPTQQSTAKPSNEIFKNIPNRNRNSRNEFIRNVSGPPKNISNISSPSTTKRSSYRKRVAKQGSFASKECSTTSYKSSMYHPSTLSSSTQHSGYPYRAHLDNSTNSNCGAVPSFMTPPCPNRNPCTRTCNCPNPNNEYRYRPNNTNSCNSNCTNYDNQSNQYCKPCSHHYRDYTSDTCDLDEPNPFKIYCDDSSTDYCPLTSLQRSQNRCKY